MPYAVKEIFKTLQGEGAHAGRVAVFCRFSGCNLWSGREQDRDTAQCTFCDTDFTGMNGPGGGRFGTAHELAAAVERAWNGAPGQRFVVCTGGEPLLQLDSELVGALHNHGFTIAIETNGTLLPPEGIDWICVSPKGRASVVLTKGDELKVVYPQDDLDLAQFETWDFKNFFVQPKDCPAAAENLGRATAYCLENPKWRLSLQTHKMIGIP